VPINNTIQEIIKKLLELMSFLQLPPTTINPEISIKKENPSKHPSATIAG